jgi:hypothetical protein
MLREGSFALASFGRIRKVHEKAVAVAFGRKSVALKRIMDAAFGWPNFPGESSFADLCLFSAPLPLPVKLSTILDS